MNAATAHIEIGGKAVGMAAMPFVIAEIGLNHGGSLARALALVDAAADAGASAVKLQTLDAALLVAADAPPPAHVEAGSMLDFFRTFELDTTAHEAIVARARTHGLAVMATPLSEPAVAMLEMLGIDAFKIASGDITYARLIRACAATRKPVVISTGMSSLDEVAIARRWAINGGASGVALLHCVSSYPVLPGHEQLRSIATLLDAFGGPVGLSDHATDTAALPVAIALGASLYERHVMLDRDDGSIDAAVSSTPHELAVAIAQGRRAWQALGDARRQCGDIERANLVPSRRGLYARRTLRPGDVVRADDVVALRPARGLAADCEDALLGQVMTRTVERGTPFVERDLAGRRGIDRVA